MPVAIRRPRSASLSAVAEYVPVFIAVLNTRITAADFLAFTPISNVTAAEALPLILKAAIATAPFLIPAVSVTIPARACADEAAIVIKGSAPFIKPPICSFTSPKVLANCCCLPLSVFANSAFISPTLLVITCASIAARCCSVPYFSTCSSASLNVIPTRVSAEVWPCITLPIKLPTLIASWVVAFKPFCCANKLFIAGSKVSRLSFSVKNVAICCAPDSCTSSPITPNSCCALARSLILCISASVAPIRWRITVASLTSFTSCTAYASAKSFIQACSWLKLRCAASILVASAAKFIAPVFSCCASLIVDDTIFLRPSASLAKSLKPLPSPSSLKVILIVLFPAIVLYQFIA